jgi:GT2 family glycosyltransferase
MFRLSSPPSSLCMHNLELSVIIINYNGLKFIEQCLKSVLNADYTNFEVILVDNASQDGSPELAKKLFKDKPRLRIIENKNNLGFAQGNNIGAKHAKGHVLVFLNVDTEVDRNWLKDLLEVIESDDRIGATQCKLLIAQDESKLESVGHYVDYTGTESAESTSIKGQFDKDQYNLVREIFYARGAAMAVKRDIFFKAGMFDPTYFMDHEEIDLCWRIRLLGYKIVFVPKSIVYHYGGALVGKREENPTILFHLRKNHITSLIKNYQLKNTIKYLPIYLTFLFGHACLTLLEGKTSITLVYIKAIQWVLENFKHIYIQRLKIQHSIRRVPDSAIMKHMTKPRIPWHFFE